MELTFTIPFNELPKTKKELINKLRNQIISNDEIFYFDKSGDCIEINEECIDIIKDDICSEIKFLFKKRNLSDSIFCESIEIKNSYILAESIVFSNYESELKGNSNEKNLNKIESFFKYLKNNIEKLNPDENSLLSLIEHEEKEFFKDDYGKFESVNSFIQMISKLDKILKRYVYKNKEFELTVLKSRIIDDEIKTKLNNAFKNIREKDIKLKELENKYLDLMNQNKDIEKRYLTNISEMEIKLNELELKNLDLINENKEIEKTFLNSTIEKDRKFKEIDIKHLNFIKETKDMQISYLNKISEKDSKIKELEDKILEMKNQKKEIEISNLNKINDKDYNQKKEIEICYLNKISEKDSKIKEIEDKLCDLTNQNKETEISYLNKIKEKNGNLKELEDKVRDLTNQFKDIQISYINKMSEKDSKLKELEDKFQDRTNNRIEIEISKINKINEKDSKKKELEDKYQDLINQMKEMQISYINKIKEKDHKKKELEDKNLDLINQKKEIEISYLNKIKDKDSKQIELEDKLLDMTNKRKEIENSHINKMNEKDSKLNELEYKILEMNKEKKDLKNQIERKISELNGINYKLSFDLECVSKKIKINKEDDSYKQIISFFKFLSENFELFNLEQDSNSNFFNHEFDKLKKITNDKDFKEIEIFVNKFFNLVKKLKERQKLKIIEDESIIKLKFQDKEIKQLKEKNSQLFNELNEKRTELFLLNEKFPKINKQNKNNLDINLSKSNSFKIINENESYLSDSNIINEEKMLDIKNKLKLNYKLLYQNFSFLMKNESNEKIDNDLDSYNSIDFYLSEISDFIRKYEIDIQKIYDYYVTQSQIYKQCNLCLKIYQNLKRLCDNHNVCDKCFSINFTKCNDCGLKIYF